MKITINESNMLFKLLIAFDAKTTGDMNIVLDALKALTPIVSDFEDAHVEIKKKKRDKDIELIKLNAQEGKKEEKQNLEKELLDIEGEFISLYDTFVDAPFTDESVEYIRKCIKAFGLKELNTLGIVKVRDNLELFLQLKQRFDG